MTLNNLSAGTYLSYVEYAGDANYSYHRKTFNLNIVKATPTVTLTQDGTNVIATVSGNVTGNVTFNIHGESYTINLVDGKATLLHNLTPGNTIVVVEYNGDKNYTKAFGWNTFGIDQYVTPINATPTNITYGENEIINVTVNKTATGYIVINIGGNRHLLPLENGTALFNISDLAPGKYENITVTYSGDDNFKRVATNISFKVDPTDKYKIDVTVYDISYGQNATVRVLVATDAVGNVTISIDGKVIKTVNLTNGVAVLDVEGLAGGNHVVNVTYNGGPRYASKNNGTTFKVNPASWKVNITEVDYRPYGQTTTINITNIPSDFTAKNLTIKIDGVSYVVPIVDGKASLKLSNLSAGSHSGLVVYAGDANYSAISQVFRPNIPQAKSTITLEEVNGDIVATVSGVNATGNVTFYVNGAEYTIDLTSQKTATLTKDHLSFGINGVVAIYNGDKNYTSARTVENFTIDKIPTDLTVVAAPDIAYLGQNTRITVTMVNVTKGKVLIEINNNYNYTVEIKDGIAVLDVVLPVGDYTVKAYYFGNSTHEASNKSGNAFKVLDKTTPVINITVPSDVKVGQTVEIPVSSNGYNFTVWINGVNQTITDGKITYAVTEAGIYTIYANTTENDTYYSVERTEIFEAFKTNATLIISEIGTIYVGDEITITLTTGITDGEITIKVDDTVIGADGKFTPLLEGKYTITVVSKETGKYYEGFNSTVFTVIKRNSQINVTATGAVVGDNATITVKTYANATGYVTVNVNGTNYTIPLNNVGEGSLQIPGLGNGTYMVNVTYLGDDQYKPSTNSTTFEMTKVNATMTISVSDITYRESANITVTITPGATGYITIRVNNTRTVTLPIVEGKVNWIVSGLGANNYTVWANYSGDGKYNINNTDKVNKSFEVKKADPDLSAIVEGVVYQNATVKIFIDKEIHGKVVNVTVNGALYPNVSVDEEFIAQVLNEYRPYTVIVEYGGNENFTDDRVQQSFTPSKITNYGLTVYGMNITVGDEEIITVEVPNHADDVVIWVNGAKFRNTSFSGNKATFNITGLNLKQGIYTVTATVNDTEIDHINFTALFTVSKTYPTMNITVFNNESIYVGDTVKVVVSVPKDVTESVTIEINNIKLTNKTVNGNATFYIPSITYGNKTVVAVYVGDDKYYYNSTTANFTVSKRNSQVNVSATGDNVGGKATITVQVQSNATGYVTVNVNGTNYTIALNSTGAGSVNITGLGNGTYYVYATYLGDDQYLPSTNVTETFDMIKVDPVINIAVDNVPYGSDTVIVVTVPGATGNITIKINDTDKGEFTLVNGKVTYNAGILGVENYTVYVSYKGDDKYATGSADKDFNVTKATPYITIDCAPVDANTNATVTVTINSDASGSLNITVNNKNYTASILGGVASFTVDKLPVGKYDIVANYAGDANYTARVNETLIDGLEVIKVQYYEMNVSAVDVHVGENTTITVHVPKDATGNVTVWVNGTQIINSTIVDGVATVQLNKTISGRYVVNATLSDKKYANQTVYTAYWVSKVDIPIVITVVNEDNIKVGDTVKVVVSVPKDVTENVTIEINNIKLTNKTVNGDAIFYIPSITYGNKTVVAAYVGDDKYLFNSTTANFTVSKRNSQVNVTVTSPIEVGDNATVTVKTYENATGYVIVNVDGNNYTINLTDGEGSVVISGLMNETYKVNVTYIGDDQYLSSINATQSIKVNKVDSSINLTVSDNGIIANGSDVNITIKAPADVTGKVTVTVTGAETVKTYTVYVNDGEGILHLDSPAIGTYTVTAVYLTNDKYNQSTNDTSFEVFSTSGALNVDSLTVAVNEHGQITVTIGENHADDEVTIIVTGANGEVIKQNATFTYAEGVSTATLDTGLLDAGSYDVTAIYKEIDGTKTTVHRGTSAFNVYKLASQITIKELNATIFVGETENITLAIELDENHKGGDISVWVNGVEYTTTTSELVVRIPNLNADDYNVKVVYHGNEWYNESSTTGSFKVVKNPTPITVEVTNSTFDSVEQINVTVPAGVSGQILLDIDGQHYYANVTATGLAQFNITGLKAGEYKFNVTYIGNYKYLANNTNATLTVSKLNATGIAVSVDNITYGQKANITVTVPDGITGNVTIKLNDTNNRQITLPVYDGKVNWIVENLAGGVYAVNVTYNGNNKYNVNSTISTKFRVNRADPIVESSATAIVGKNGEIVVYIKPGVYGGVIINNEQVVVIGLDKEYTKTIESGIVTIVTDTPLEYREYTYIVKYSGDENYTGFEKSFTFTPDKVTDYELNITAEDVEVDNLTNITVNVPDDASGKVIVDINGTNYTATIKDGKAIFNNQTGLPVGKYNITAYFGDDKYVNKTATGVFYINKHETPITIDVGDIKVGDTAVINVTAPGDVLNDVYIEIDGVKYAASAVSDGKAVFKVQILSNGTRTVVATYDGGNKYKFNSTTAKFTVVKNNLTITVQNIDNIIYVGSPVTITANLNETVTGDVVFNINGINYNVHVDNADSASYTYTPLNNATLTVVATFMGNDKYNSNASKEKQFIVNRTPTSIQVTFNSPIISSGDDAYVIITMDPSINANVILHHGDKDYDVAVVEGKGYYAVSNLNRGNYTVTAEFAGDDKYANSTSEPAYLTVNMISTKLNITLDKESINVGENATVSIVLNQSINAIVTLKINGNNHTVGLVNGKGSLTLTDLANGTYIITAVFAGDDRYNQSISNNVILKVNKIITDINATVKVPVTYGNDALVTVELNVTINATVRLSVDGKEYNVALVDGKGIFNASGLNSGDHTVNVVFADDGMYTRSTNSTTFTIGNANLAAEVIGLNVTVEQNSAFAINVTDDFKGNVSIKVGDKVLYNGTVKSLIEAAKLLSGDKTATVVFYGDSNYNKLTLDNVKFTVSKVTPTINVTVADVTYPSKAVAVINISNMANGTVKVNLTVPGTTWSKVIDGTVSNGQAIVDLTGLSGGNYDVKVEFISSDDYNKDATAFTKFTVLPNNSLININMTKKTYAVGEDIEIKFEVINSTGDLKILIDGVYYNTYSPNPQNHTICLTGYGEGEYHITAVLAGDENYTGFSTTTDLTVVKNNLTINVDKTTDPSEIYVGSPVKITANLNETVTGEVIFTINGMNYTVSITNAKVATCDYTPVNNATLTVVANFTGNDRYNSKVSAPKQFTVSRVASSVSLSDVTIEVGQTAKIVVTVTSGATGVVNVTVNGVTQSVGLVDSKATVYVSGLVNDTYPIAVKYLGDDKYADSVNNDYNVIVNKISTYDFVVIASDTVVGGSSVVTVIMPSDADGNITIDGKTAKVVGGKATIVLDKETSAWLLLPMVMTVSMLTRMVLLLIIMLIRQLLVLKLLWKMFMSLAIP